VPDVLEMRGEVYMTKKDFAALNKKQEKGRRAALRQSAQRRGRARAPARSPITAARPLRFFAYAWGEMSAMPAETSRHDRAVRAGASSRPIR
jgi:DNA ligase (NAD+)